MQVDVRGWAMSVPDELRYSKDHEWVRLTGSRAVIGITAHAADELGDVVFVDLPAIGSSLAQFKVFGAIESVKAVSELFSPLSGDVVAVTGDLTHVGLPSEYRAVGEWLTGFGTPAAITVIPGNHDSYVAEP